MNPVITQGKVDSVNHESQWIIGIHNLSASGVMRRVETEIPAPADMKIALIGVDEGEPIRLDLRLEAVVEGVLVSGELTTRLHGQCSRCLNEFFESTIFEVQELVYYPGHEMEEDAYLVSDDTIDLEPLARDAIVLKLPFSPLCDEDCAGLCPVCGLNLNDNPSHEHEAEIDDRWAKLRGLDLS